MKISDTRFIVDREYTAVMAARAGGVLDVAARVIANTHLSGDYNVLALAAPAIAASVSAGQFVMLKARAGHDPLLRRPFSVFEILRDQQGTVVGLTVLSKRIGPSTALLYDARPHDVIACLGPLGRPFTIVEPPVEAWMVAGGVGLAPFATLAETLTLRGVRCTLFYGAQRSVDLFYVDFFRALGVNVVLATEDGSAGEHGRVTGPLSRMLSVQNPAAPLMVYACGPEGMLAATARLAAANARPCQVSVERIMGCGLGGCYSCVVPVRGEDGRAHNVRSCLSGPVLAAEQIVW
jgi:dihydroorotate dehydrogenase electron transfer subunit